MGPIMKMFFLGAEKKLECPINLALNHEYVVALLHANPIILALQEESAWREKWKNVALFRKKHSIFKLLS